MVAAAGVGAGGACSGGVGDGGDGDEAHIPSEIMMGEQVFNVPSNSYTYTDAVALCKAYGAKLANYKQIENSYKKGGEWCNYGWSDDQMALFPTQQATWDKLQTIKGHENDCGRPGINGGYIVLYLIQNYCLRFCRNYLQHL